MLARNPKSLVAVADSIFVCEAARFRLPGMAWGSEGIRHLGIDETLGKRLALRLTSMQNIMDNNSSHDTRFSSKTRSHRINKRSFHLELMCLYFSHGAQDAQVKLVQVAEQTAGAPCSMHLCYDDSGYLIW